jgi:hypothetical protein
MTNEQINIAIAEACGWTDCVTPHQDEYHFLSDAELGDAMGRTVGRRLPAGLHEPIPNYCNDLNAMHEAERTLNLSLAGGYARILTSIAWQSEQPVFAPMTATARQRAEAFLRTLGKWEESE